MRIPEKIIDMKVTSVDQLKKGQYVKIKRKPASWSSTLNRNNPIGKVSFPYTIQIKEVKRGSNGTAITCGKYGWHLDSIVKAGCVRYTKLTKNVASQLLEQLQVYFKTLSIGQLDEHCRHRFGSDWESIGKNYLNSIEKIKKSKMTVEEKNAAIFLILQNRVAQIEFNRKNQTIKNEKKLEDERKKYQSVSKKNNEIAWPLWILVSVVVMSIIAYANGVTWPLLIVVAIGSVFSFFYRW
jgi:hypothetical protein